MRNMSFMLTKEQFRDRSKDVTRRNGWKNLKPGELVCGVEKYQGLGKGEKIQRLGVIRIKSVRREKLNRMVKEPRYGIDECRREGFPGMGGAWFVKFYCATHKKVKPAAVITRIEYEYASPA